MNSRADSAPFGLPRADHGVVDLVKEAQHVASPRHHPSSFSFTTTGIGSRYIAVLLGLYLSWVVARVPEVFPQVFIPRLPMISMAIFLLAIFATVPGPAWRELWRHSVPFRCVVVLYALAWITAPLGIWMSGSMHAASNRYAIAVITFLACFIFLRDRRNLRIAVSIFVVTTAIIAAYTLLNYDPTAVPLNEAGLPIADEALDISRMRVKVSISLDPNDWGAVLTATIPLALWLGTGARMMRPFWWGTALLLTAALVPTQSRGSLLGLIACALVLVGVGATGWRRVFMLLLVVGGGFVFATVASAGELNRFLDFGTDDYNFAGREGRKFFWQQGMVWMIKRPWGYGIDNYPTYFGWLNGPERAAHSSWVQYGMELGVAGLAAFVFLVYTLVKRNRLHRKLAIALRTRYREVADAEASLAGYVLAMLAAVLVTGSFLSYAYYPLMYMALGIASAALLGFPFRDQAAFEGDSAVSAPPTAPGRRRRSRA